MKEKNIQTNLSISDLLNYIASELEPMSSDIAVTSSKLESLVNLKYKNIQVLRIGLFKFSFSYRKQNLLDSFQVNRVQRICRQSKFLTVD